MALENYAGISPVPFLAGGTIAKNALVKLDTTAGQVVAAGAETDLVIGVALKSAVSGDQVPVQIGGIAKVIASAAVTLADQLEPAASGKCATAGGATSKSFGIALEAAAADGDIIRALLAVPNVNGPANA